MKKLMTMLSAVAMAFGLHATSPSDTGTSFEGLTGDATGTPYDIYENGLYGTTQPYGGELSELASGQTYWKTNNTAEVPELKIIAGTSIDVSSKRPGQYEYAQQSNFLRIKTTLGNPVTRNVNVDATGTAIGDGFYFDSLVRFTAFDSDPTIDLGNDGKLAIWLKEEIGANDIPTATNLVLTAGYIDENLGSKVVQTNYSCIVGNTVNLCDGGWHRVTVKAIDNIYSGSTVRPGFVVFIDGLKVKSGAEKGIDEANLTPVADSYNTDGALFPSAVQTGDPNGALCAIKSVSFDGQGDVDDLVFTATAPDFATVSFYQLKLGENVESVSYVANTSGGAEIESGTITAASPAKFIAYEDRMYVEITDIQYAAGYMSAGVDGVGVDAETGYYKPGAPNLYTEFLAKAAGATVDGVSYETLADAFTMINSSNGTFAVKITADAEGPISLTSATTVVLDLAGNNIEGDGSAYNLITVGPGATLEITNSTETVGHVVSGAPAQEAAVGSSGNLIIGGGLFDGIVDIRGTQTASILGGGFSIADNADELTYLNAAVPKGYELAPELLLPPTYYVITEKAPATTYTVTYKPGQYGTEAESTDTKNGGEDLTLAGVTFTRTGYTQTGWATTDGGAQAYALEGTYSTDADIDLYPVWTIDTYTVTFMVDGVEFDTETADYNTTLDIKPGNPSKSGYSFEGWSTDGTAANIVDLDEYLVVDDVTLYAVWEEEKHDAGAAFDPPSGYTAESFAAAINNGTADIADYLAIPAGVSSSGNYCDLFKATNINDKVEFVLNETAEAAVAAEANAAAATIVATPGSVPGTLTIDAEPGLYYSIAYGTSLSNMSEGDRTQATDTGSDPTVENGTITLDMPTPALGATSGFYKVIVSIADKPAPEPDQGQD